MSGEGIQLLEDRLKAKATTKPKALPPGIWQAIIAALLQLIQGWLNPTPASFAAGVGNAFKVASHLKASCPSMSWSEAFEQALSAIETIAAMTEAEFASLWKDCCD